MKPEKVAFARRLVGGAAWLLSACYSTVTVAPDEFFGMGKELSGARITNGAGGTPVLVDAQSMVRAHLRQGEVTAWFKAGDLTVTPEGLIVGPGLPASEVSVARVTDLGGEQLQLLKELAPSGGSVGPSRAGEGYQLAASFGETLPWAIRFASQCQGRSLSAGVWHLRRSDSFAGLVDFDGSGSAVVAGRVLAEAPATSSFTLAPGIRRADVLRLEVNFFDPLSSAAAVPLFPFVLVALMLDPEGTEAGMSSASSTWEPRATIWSDSSAARLFTGQLSRRSWKTEPSRVSARSGCRKLRLRGFGGTDSRLDSRAAQIERRNEESAAELESAELDRSRGEGNGIGRWRSRRHLCRQLEGRRG